MNLFRERTPRRRATPTKAPTGNNWREHKEDLKEDFNSKCGYCDSLDTYRNTYFEIDHFIPRDFFNILGGIAPTDYFNLVYSCRFCNNGKRAKWPTQSLTSYNDGTIGFDDPASDLYDTHFYRTEDGSIMWTTDVGKWMFNEAFNFSKRQTSIKLIWNLERLQKVIDSLLTILQDMDNSSSEYRELKQKIGEYCLEFYSNDKELREFYG